MRTEENVSSTLAICLSAARNIDLFTRYSVLVYVMTAGLAQRAGRRVTAQIRNSPRAQVFADRLKRTFRSSNRIISYPRSSQH